MSEDSKFFLKDSDVPKQWYNLVADLKEPMSPPLHPGTKQPISNEHRILLTLPSPLHEAPATHRRATAAHRVHPVAARSLGHRSRLLGFSSCRANPGIVLIRAKPVFGRLLLAYFIGVLGWREQNTWPPCVRMLNA